MATIRPLPGRLLTERLAGQALTSHLSEGYDAGIRLHEALDRDMV